MTDKRDIEAGVIFIGIVSILVCIIGLTFAMLGIWLGASACVFLASVGMFVVMTVEA